jgi:hypothetical protein
MSAFGFLVLAPVYWIIGTYPPFSIVALVSGCIAIPHAIICGVMGTIDIIETFRMWTDRHKDEIMGGFDEEKSEGLLAEHTKVPVHDSHH